MKLIRLMGPIVLILLFLAVFFLRSKPDSQTPTVLQFNQSNALAGTSSQTSDVSPSTSDVDFAAIQGPPKPPPLKIQQITPVKYAMKSLNQDVIEIGTERHSPASPYQVKPAPSNKPISIMGLPFIKIAEASQGGPPKPYLKLNKWEGEAVLKVSIPYNTSETPEEFDGKLRYKGDGVKVDFYPKAPEEITEKDSQGNEQKYTINEEGGVEFDTILSEKPTSNQISFPIETQNLDFFYQPPLTQKEKDEGAFRPENVVGSYAVYHDSKQGDYSKMGGKNYKAGKAFHIYRPKIKDAQGNEIWGELKINEQNNTLTITIDQNWLNNAVYPVTIDPNFGYEGIGGTTDNRGGDAAAHPKGTPADGDGEVDSISAYAKLWFGTPSLKGVIWLYSDKSIITNGIGGTVAISSTAQWWNVTYSTKPSVVNGTAYYVGVIGSSGVTHYYDTGVAGDGGYSDNSYTTPANLGDIYSNNRKYSIYATYTAAAAPTPASQTDFSGVDMQGVNIN